MTALRKLVLALVIALPFTQPLQAGTLEDDPGYQAWTEFLGWMRDIIEDDRQQQPIPHHQTSPRLVRSSDGSLFLLLNHNDIVPVERTRRGGHRFVRVNYLPGKWNYCYDQIGGHAGWSDRTGKEECFF